MSPVTGEQRSYVSLDPATYVEGGGGPDDIDVTIADARFTMFDYGGKTDDGKSKVTLGIQFADAEGNLHDQYYSAGDGFEISKDGGGLVPKAEGAALNKNTNCALFLASLIGVGFPKERLAEMPINEALTGTKIHVNQIAQPKRPGLVKQAGKAEKTICMATSLISLPGAKGAAKPKAGGLGAGTKAAAAPAKGPAAPVATAATAPDDELVAAANEALVGILAAHDGSVPKAKLAVFAFREIEASNPFKKQIIPLLGSEEFLSAAEGITYDGATVTLG